MLDEDRHLERQRHPGASGAGPGMDRARAPGRRLPAGNQSHVRSGADRPLRDGGLLVLLARRQGLLRRRACTSARRSRPSGPPSRIPPSTTRTASSPSIVGDLTVASIYVPNGGKDFPAKMKFLEAMDAYAASFQAQRPRAGRCCGDMNVARTDRDVHPKERKPRAIGQLPEERALIERIIGRGLVDVGRALDPDNDGLFTWWAPWRNMRRAQHRLAARLRARERGAGGTRHRVPGAERRRHQRSRAGRRDVRTVSREDSKFAAESAVRVLREPRD